MPESLPTAKVLVPREPFWELVIEAQIEQPADADVDRFLKHLVDNFVSLGGYGAFCRPDIQPDKSEMTIRGSENQGGLHRWHLRVEEVDPGCVPILRNLLIGFSLSVHPLSRFEIHAPGVNSMRLGRIDSDPDMYGYPEVTNRLPFAVQWIPTASPTTYRRLEVLFPAPPSDDDFETFARLVDRWEWITIDGFPTSEADLETGRCSIEDVNAKIFDELTFEVVVKTFGGSEDAWNPLLNALGKFDRSVHSIDAVTVE